MLSGRASGRLRTACTSALTVWTASWLRGSGRGGAFGHTIGVIKRVPAPPPSRNQQAATLSSPPLARSCARRTYSCAKPWLPCKSKILGKGPVPLGRATAAIKPPTSGTVMSIHWASSLSVPAGASATETIGFGPIKAGLTARPATTSRADRWLKSSSLAARPDGSACRDSPGLRSTGGSACGRSGVRGMTRRHAIHGMALGGHDAADALRRSICFQVCPIAAGPRRQSTRATRVARNVKGMRCCARYFGPHRLGSLTSCGAPSRLRERNSFAVSRTTASLTGITCRPVLRSHSSTRKATGDRRRAW